MHTGPLGHTTRVQSLSNRLNYYIRAAIKSAKLTGMGEERLTPDAIVSLTYYAKRKKKKDIDATTSHYISNRLAQLTDKHIQDK